MITLLLCIISALLGFAIGFSLAIMLAIEQEKKDGVYDRHNSIIRDTYGRGADGR